MQRLFCAFRQFIVLVLGLAAMACACAEDIAIMNANLTEGKDSSPGLYLHLDVEFDLSRNIEDTLQRGIPLYFITDFRLERHRWYWMDKRIAEASLMTRLSYSPLTRQYRLSRGGLSQSFDSLKEALSTLKSIHNWRVSNRHDLGDPLEYEAEVRMRLDAEQLPLPMLVGIGDDDWNLDSDWQTISLEKRAPDAED